METTTTRNQLTLSPSCSPPPRKTPPRRSWPPSPPSCHAPSSSASRAGPGSAAWLGAAPPPSSAPPRCQSHPRSSRGSSPLSISYPSPSSPISSCPSPWIGDRNSNFSIPQVCYFVLLFLPIILLIFPLILFFNSFILPHHFFPYFFPNILFLYHKQTGFRTCSTF